ncbi:MAG: DUF883 family protein [Proteobacteria bacterium]|nr:DUF883 family protein [Pseudomonadota bacterium]
MAQSYGTTYGKTTSELEDRARATAANVADKASDLASKAGEQLEGVMSAAEKKAKQVAAQGRDAGERVQEVAGNMKGAIDKSVREQPMATLAVAAAIGFIVGALWKS